MIVLSIAYVASEKPDHEDRGVTALGGQLSFRLGARLRLAGPLAEVGLPANGLAAALVGFNLAVGAEEAPIIGVFPNASDVIYNTLLASSA